MVMTATKLPSIYTQAQAETFTLVDITAGETFRVTGKEFLIFIGAAGGEAVTITSTADPFGRTGNVVVTLGAGAGAVAVWGPAESQGFADASGDITVTGPVNCVLVTTN